VDNSADVHILTWQGSPGWINGPSARRAGKGGSPAEIGDWCCGPDGRKAMGMALKMRDGGGIERRKRPDRIAEICRLARPRGR
jgi:hypothetical protein